MGGYKYRVFLRKRPGLQNGVRLQGVSVRRGSTVGAFMTPQSTDLNTKPRACNRAITVALFMDKVRLESKDIFFLRS